MFFINDMQKTPTIVDVYKPFNNEVLYHYCSASSFLKIISSKTLWLCDIRHMNDCEEIQYGEKLFIKVLKECNIQEEIKKSIFDIYNEIYKRLILLSTSFSESKEILSQWRGYADDARGFCIGFDANSLTSKTPFCPLKIEYERNEQEEIMNKIIKKIQAYLEFDNMTNLTIISLISELIEVFAKVKHPAFSEEKEVRLTHTLLLNEDKTLTDEVKEKWPSRNYGLHDVEFRLVGGIPTPYVSIDFPDTDNFIKEVIIGPKNISKISDIELFLANNNIKKVEIKKNLFPYV